MDLGRQTDLRKLQAVIDDPLKSKFAKTRAAEAKSAIILQMRDKKLTKLRLRLVKAAQSYDKAEEYNISCQIKDYMKQQKFEES